MRYQVTAVNPRTSAEQVVPVEIAVGDIAEAALCGDYNGHLSKILHTQMPADCLMIANTLRYINLQ